jgi:predicted nuclease of predicted toxin-antitoxin system
VKFKLDENLGKQPLGLFVREGHDAVTVADQQLRGVSDQKLIAVCRDEKRCLVTLDMDFGNPLVFPPEEYSGIAVLRLPGQLSRAVILDGCETLVAALRRADITGKLWIVQQGRIREHIRE